MMPRSLALVTLLATLVGLQTIGMDGMIIVLCWGMLGVLALATFGELVIVPMRARKRRP